LWLFSEPLPFTPSVGDCGVVGPVVGQIDRPHDSGIVIGGNGLIFEGGEVSPAAAVAVHGGTEGASVLIIANNAIISDDCSRGSEELTGPINNLVVLLSRAENVPASTEPP
jgi:hypothetical protein